MIFVAYQYHSLSICYCPIYVGESHFVINTTRFDTGLHSLTVTVSTLSGQFFTQSLIFVVEGQL